MMEFGYLGSSSNLSALAPPFTLDRTINKPNSEPFLHLTNHPPSVPFSSSLPSWQYPNSSSDSSVDFGVDSIRTTYLPSESYYPYFGAPSISSTTTHTPPLNANISTSPDAFVFPPYSSPIPTSYVEPKPDYDLSSNSHGDHLQSLSGLKYTPHWGNYWGNIDRLADDGQMGKRVDYNGSFCSTQINKSYGYKSFPDQGSSTAEGFSRGILGKESPPARRDLFGGESQIVTPVTSEVNSKPFPTQGSSFTRYDHARTLGISIYPISHANGPLFEAAATTSNHQKPYGSQDQTFQAFNAGKSESITTKRSSPLVVIRPPPVRLDKKEHFCDSFPSITIGDLSNKSLSENVESHVSEKELQIPAMNAPPYSLTSASDGAKSTSSVEGSLGNLDRYYPALDSPCWKGVSSFRFSPSEDNEPAISEHIVEKPEPLGATKFPQTPFCTPFSEDNAKFSSQKAPENGYVELGPLLCPDSLPDARNPMKADDSIHENRVDHTNMSISNLDSFNNNIEKLTKEFDSCNDSRICSDSKPVQWKKPDFEHNIGFGFGVTDAGLDCNSASSKLDVQKLIETIYILSTLLLRLCSDAAEAFSEVGYESLKLAMKNLDACVSKMIPNPTQGLNLQKSVISGRPQLPKEATSSLGFDLEQETKKIENSEKEVKKLTDLFSSNVDEDFEKDNKVTQAIKNVFEENFGAKEHMQPEAILYKSLWLEAEAALCSVSFRARYNRMKTEMDKYKLPPKIEVQEPAKTFEELYNEVFPDPSSPGKGNPIIEAFKISHKSNQDPSSSRKTEGVDEVGTSCRPRLDILNKRVSNQNSAYAGEQRDEEDVDAAFADTIKSVEKLLSSDDTEDCAITKLTQKVPSSSTIKTVGNVEASVMTRLQILKNRDFSEISQESGQKSKRGF